MSPAGSPKRHHLALTGAILLGLATSLILFLAIRTGAHWNRWTVLVTGLLLAGLWIGYLRHGRDRIVPGFGFYKHLLDHTSEGVYFVIRLVWGSECSRQALGDSTSSSKPRRRQSGTHYYSSR